MLQRAYVYLSICAQHGCETALLGEFVVSFYVRPGSSFRVDGSNLWLVMGHCN